jgi:hypothetical protein
MVETIIKKGKTTIFENIKVIEDGSQGRIKTVSTLPVWDCYEKRFNGTYVILRNVLLAVAHPSKTFTIGKIKKTETNPFWLSPFNGGDFGEQELDLASGSRNDGSFTFTEKGRRIGTLYFGKLKADIWKPIIYGSIMHTDCKKAIYKDINYIVVDDENYVEGVQLDDAINNRNWFTGDSHAKASSELMTILGLTQEEINSTNPPDSLPENRAIQFRALVFQEFVGKGTVAYNPDLDELHPDITSELGGKIDLVIPLSSLKGNKPALGVHRAKVVLGLVFEGETRKSKLGWMLLQWFSFSVLEQDGIITKLVNKLAKLKNAINSYKELVKLLKPSDAANPDGTLENEEKYDNKLISIILADSFNLLQKHPWVTRRVADMTQKKWINYAKSAGVFFYSVMTQPDEHFAQYLERDENGNIISGRYFCCASYPEGEYIVFANPMRHWGDVQLWENAHQGKYFETVGVAASSKELMLTLGRDFDGDFIQLIQATEYPNMRDAIASFNTAPKTVKFPKVALEGDLKKVAIRSMNDLTGRCATLLARARTAGVENIVLLIPDDYKDGTDPEKITYKEYRLIDFLSQQVQIAVDSLKSAYPNNIKGLDAVESYLDNLLKQGIDSLTPWLSDFKNKDCYRTRICNVDENAQDTISRLVKLVNSYWVNLSLETSQAQFFTTALWGYLPMPTEQQKKTNWQWLYISELRREYGSDMRAVKDDDSKRVEVMKKWREMKATIYAKLDPVTNQLKTQESWNSYIWKVAHHGGDKIIDGEKRINEAGFAFVVISDEIQAQLTKEGFQDVEVFRCHEKAWGANWWYWCGQKVTVKYQYEWNNSNKEYEWNCYMKWDNSTKTGFHRLGTVGEKYERLVSEDLEYSYKIVSFRQVKRWDKVPGQVFRCTHALLKDPNLPLEYFKNMKFIKQLESSGQPWVTNRLDP